MIPISFDAQGHIQVRPCDILAAAASGPRDLVNDVLCHGTPVTFATYNEYREFISLVANELEISPLAIWIRGSGHLGFSIAPNAAKIWVGHGPDSDIDLAIVDPDRYHVLDTQIRSAERSEELEFNHEKKLRDGRRYYQYRHRDLPQTPACDDYKKKVDELSKKMEREVTAFFFRDTWALHERWVTDLRDLLKQWKIGLPNPGDTARIRKWPDDSALPAIKIDAEELNLARPFKMRHLGITDAGLRQIKTFGVTKRIWLDSCGVGETGLASLPPSSEVVFLSLADTKIGDGAFDILPKLFPNLMTLVLDATQGISWEKVHAFCQGSRLITLSIKNCRWVRGRPRPKNAVGRFITVVV